MSMYFDHSRCPSCGLAFDPEKLSTVDGQPACPHCSAPMKLVNMFGIADAFAEDDPEPMTLDDLVPGDFSSPGARPEPQESAPRAGQTSRSGSQMHRAVSREEAQPTPAQPPSSDSLPARVPKSDDSGGGARSAMDVMREMRGRKKR